MTNKECELLAVGLTLFSIPLTASIIGAIIYITKTTTSVKSLRGYIDYCTIPVICMAAFSVLAIILSIVTLVYPFFKSFIC